MNATATETPAMNTQQQTLSEVLALIGIRHEPSAISGKREWFNASGEHIGTFDAHEGWAKLRRLTALVVIH